MTPTKIKIKLLEAGIRQTELAREYGCSPVSIHQVISGKRRSRGIRRFIAHKLSEPVERIFPDTELRAA